MGMTSSLLGVIILLFIHNWAKELRSRELLKIINLVVYSAKKIKFPSTFHFLQFDENCDQYFPFLLYWSCPSVYVRQIRISTILCPSEQQLSLLLSSTIYQPSVRLLVIMIGVMSNKTGIYESFIIDTLNEACVNDFKVAINSRHMSVCYIDSGLKGRS